MKDKNIVLLLFLLVVPLSFAYEYNLNYDSTQNTVTIGYDNLNRITQKNSSSEIINYSYDVQLQGTLSNLSFGNSTYKYTYNNRLRVIEEKRIIDGIEFIKKYIYDSNDRLISFELSSGQDLDFYYSPQGKIDKIRGYINKTNYNAFGSPLNRTYFNNKITTFDYYSDNARLKQIKTDTTQILNYSYDNVGNIVSINDQANNRLYSMSYDRLDRLTNVTIGSYNWIYNYDAIGNILKIIRNQSTTTSFKFDSSLAHAPQKYIVTNTSADVYRQNNLNTSSKTKIIEFYLVNEKNSSITNVNWSAEFEDSNFVNSNIPFNLSKNENTLVIIEHNYTKGGNYKANITAITNGSLSDYESLKIVFGAIANSLGILKQNASTIVSEFDAKNTINGLSLNWNWNCTNGVQSSVPFNMSANEDLLVVMEHNYSLSNPNLTCNVYSADGNQSKSTIINFDRIKVENYNSSVADSDTILVKFQIRNYFSTLDVNWNITADNLVYRSSSPITIQQGQSSSITQEINFTNAGTKTIIVNIGSGNFTDTYSENIRLYAIGIQQFFDYVKNGTTRVFDFFIKNDWTNLSAYWNFTNPSLQKSVNLSQNESLIVVIEENYNQGKKSAGINAFNSSQLEDYKSDIFTIKQIGINSFQTLYENTSKAITSSIVINNINPLNLSWQLNNTESLIFSNQNLAVNTSEQAFIIVENNFSNSSIYPLNFLINSSTYNDNATGVAVT